MKNTRISVKPGIHLEDPAVSGQPDDSFQKCDDEMDVCFPSWDNSTGTRSVTIKTLPREYVDQDSGKTVQLDPFDTTLLGHGIPNYALDPASLRSNFGPLASPEELVAIDQLYAAKPSVTPRAESRSVFYEGTGLDSAVNVVDDDRSWIQTHSGRRFNPLKPNPGAIVIQDIAHALSMQCRFSGHCREFYSVAQHSVLVSYICDSGDAFWGLMHDATEAYLVDVPRPLKRSGKFDAYLEFESIMQEAICKRFALPFREPPSVKRADTILLATEARDLMAPLHSDWKQPVDPLPFKIEAWDHQKAKDMFMKRFFELTGASAEHYQHYLKYKNQL